MSNQKKFIYPIDTYLIVWYISSIKGEKYSMTKGIRVYPVFNGKIKERLLIEAEKEGNSPTAIVRRIVTQYYKKVKESK